MTDDDLLNILRQLEREEGDNDMSITGELREWATVGRVGVWSEDLLAIADRIDEKHDRSVYEKLKDGIMFVPCDAYGKETYIGDEMVHDVCPPQDYARFTVIGIGLDVVWGDDDECYDLRQCRHYHKPTVEDVLRELLCKHQGVIAATNGDRRKQREAEIIDEYAAKLQLKEDE